MAHPSRASSRSVNLEPALVVLFSASDILTVVDVVVLGRKMLVMNKYG